MSTPFSAQEGKLYGFNTDVAGIIGPLEKRLSLRGAKVLVLGAGGAARAAVFGVRDKGAEVFILNRTPETAQKLARQSGAKTIKKDALAKTTFDVIINATPIGMAGNKATHLLEPKDLNTTPRLRSRLQPARDAAPSHGPPANIPIITGIEMFVQQGARQFEIFTGKPAPEEEMLRVVLHALRQQAEAAAAVEAEAEPKPKADPGKVHLQTHTRATGKGSAYTGKGSARQAGASQPRKTRPSQSRFKARTPQSCPGQSRASQGQKEGLAPK